MPRALLWAVLAGTLSACTAARQPVVTSPPAPAVDLNLAFRLVDEGCYRCLLDAFALYEQAHHRDGMFETAVLLSLREKELGLPAMSWIERARQLATPYEATLVDMASSVSWIAFGSAPDYEPSVKPPTDSRAKWLDALRTPAPLERLHRYLELALECQNTSSRPPEGFTPDSPLLLYRIGICGPTQRPQLDSAFAASARFVETGFFLARFETVNSRASAATVSRALPLLLAAHEAIPESPTIAIALAATWSGRKELAKSLALYDEVLLRMPHQRDALLGRATVLTYLEQPQEAIDTATQLIALGTWYLGDAYYWRAWNRYATGQLAAAAEDVIEGKKYQRGSDLLTLSGMIAYDQQRRQEARADLNEALRGNNVNCPAHWYRGLIEVDERRWEPGMNAFALATSCYTTAVMAIQGEVDDPDRSADALEQQQRDRARRLANGERQVARSALNAALLAMQVRDTKTAIAFAQIATKHELTRERAEDVHKKAAATTGQ